MTKFSLKDHQFRPGDRVDLLLFNHEDHKTGVVREVVISEKGPYYRVERKDGRLIDVDAEAEELRLSAGAAYCYAKMSGMDYIQVIKFLRETYDLSLLQAKEVIAQEAGTTVDDIQGRLAKELQPVLQD